ncbi:non-specific serine/threonine protein kinase [Flavobacterium tiangeerense]|uniref:Non-specific serine/threonine protein kinase n=1 Tax=Flavobacterium tiangeerense TaxID=459471 RepID=A0ABY3FMA0_9FLAO|nr:DEAD/DEAH box helicase [Flavobacterium tiangeerense]TWI02221.1 non-specific serine/threonine protein kinase [Flavobacterium tiangeerense]
MEPENHFQFCFDLSFEAKLNYYIPTSYVVGHVDTITYLEKKASSEVLQSMGVETKQLPLAAQKILSICESLQPEVLFKKYRTKSKAAKKIEDLLQDEKLKFGITQFIQLQLASFYALVREHDFPLSFQLGKEKDFRISRIGTQNPALETKLHFDKHENGISYTLKLKENDLAFYPSNTKVTLLLDEPGWLVSHHKLYALKSINSKKVTPFLNKKTVEIPSKLVPDYFEKFIKDIAKKVDISATGFEVITQTAIRSCNLQLVHDFFKNTYFISLTFDYNGYVFDATKTKNTHTEIDLKDLENIKLIQYKRSQAEDTFIESFEELGVSKQENQLFGLLQKTEQKDTYACVQWALENRVKLESLGFSLENLKIDGKNIDNNAVTITFSNTIQNDWFDIKMTVLCDDFEFNFSDLIPNIKSQNRLFLLPNGNYFLIPIEWMTRYAAMAKLAKINNGTMAVLKSNFAVFEEIPQLKQTLHVKETVQYQPSDLVKATLRPYQIEGVQWLLEHYNNGLGACLADDMGLGKTLQTLSTLVAVQEKLDFEKAENIQLDLFGNEIPVAKEYLKALIVLPSSLVFNWYNEARKFTPHFRRIQYVGQDRKLISKKLEKYDLIFTSYAVVARDLSILEKYQFRFLILDESQYIKNKNSKIFKAINELQTTHKISLSGTPIENSLDDLWSQMQFINPNILGSYAFFAEHYKVPIEKKQDETSLLELKNLVSPFILRRTKEQVLKDLPELSEQVFYCDMEPEQEKLYEEEKSKARNALLKTDGSGIDKINIINTLMRLRQLSNHPKMIDKKSELDSGKYIAVTRYLETLVQSNQKTIVFSSFVSNLEFYKKWSIENKIDFCELTGATPQNERAYQVQKFQEQERSKLFFISLKAGGVGLNITKASYVLFLDPWWNPFAEKQGIGRAHRIGQLNKVNVVRFITKNTVEEKIIRLQENKKLLSDALLDENHISPDIEENLDFILA